MKGPNILQLKKPIIFGLLILLAMGERLYFDLGPNVELITVVTVLAALYLGRYYSLALPLIVLVISDRFLGNSSIFLFVWSAYALFGLLMPLLRRFGAFPFRGPLFSGASSVLFSLFFFLWTNFGVWLEGLWYPLTWQGLLECYVMGLPFLRNHLLSNLIIVPLGVGLVIAGKYLFSNRAGMVSSGHSEL